MKVCSVHSKVLPVFLCCFPPLESVALPEEGALFGLYCSESSDDFSWFTTERPLTHSKWSPGQPNFKAVDIGGDVATVQMDSLTGLWYLVYGVAKNHFFVGKERNVFFHGITE